MKLNTVLHGSVKVSKLVNTNDCRCSPKYFATFFTRTLSWSCRVNVSNQGSLRGTHSNANSSCSTAGVYFSRPSSHFIHFSTGSSRRGLTSGSGGATSGVGSGGGSSVSSTVSSSFRSTTARLRPARLPRFATGGTRRFRRRLSSGQLSSSEDSSFNASGRASRRLSVTSG